LLGIVGNDGEAARMSGVVFRRAQSIDDEMYAARKARRNFTWRAMAGHVIVV
jgi:hypothetical protein